MDGLVIRANEPCAPMQSQNQSKCQTMFDVLYNSVCNGFGEDDILCMSGGNGGGEQSQTMNGNGGQPTRTMFEADVILCTKNGIGCGGQTRTMFEDDVILCTTSSATGTSPYEGGHTRTMFDDDVILCTTSGATGTSPYEGGHSGTRSHFRSSQFWSRGRGQKIRTPLVVCPSVDCWSQRGEQPGEKDTLLSPNPSLGLSTTENTLTGSNECLPVLGNDSDSVFCNTIPSVPMFDVGVSKIIESNHEDNDGVYICLREFVKLTSS